AGGRSTGHSLAPSTQIQFMNNQSKKCLSEQHCGNMPAFSLLILCSNDAHDGSDLLRTGKFGRSVGGNKTVTAVWFQ
ncbi:MAG: hypothetical protein E7L31_02945, partial [Aeromonas sp.]|nr:hypothetical protein [Aeromonas sp.]